MHPIDKSVGEQRALVMSDLLAVEVAPSASGRTDMFGALWQTTHASGDADNAGNCWRSYSSPAYDGLTLRVTCPVRALKPLSRRQLGARRTPNELL
jgi:hypothetical protein